MYKDLTEFGDPESDAYVASFWLMFCGVRMDVRKPSELIVNVDLMLDGAESGGANHGQD